MSPPPLPSSLLLPLSFYPYPLNLFILQSKVSTLLGRQVIVGPGACLTFSREGYRFFDFKLRDVIDILTNPNFYKFGIKNIGLSLNELYMDFNKRAFFKHAKKMMPEIREDILIEFFKFYLFYKYFLLMKREWHNKDMIEPSFSGVMSQVFTEDGTAQGDCIFFLFFFFFFFFFFWINIDVLERNVMGGSVLNVRNAPSPAATASFAIAEMVIDAAESDFKWKK